MEPRLQRIEARHCDFEGCPHVTYWAVVNGDENYAWCHEHMREASDMNSDNEQFFAEALADAEGKLATLARVFVQMMAPREVEDILSALRQHYRENGMCILCEMDETPLDADGNELDAEADTSDENVVSEWQHHHSATCFVTLLENSLTTYESDMQKIADFREFLHQHGPAPKGE